MDTDKLIENVAMAMYILVKPGYDWKFAFTDDPDLVSELMYRARCAVSGFRITDDSARKLDLSFKRAFVEGS